jgi:hypothetical protein
LSGEETKKTTVDLPVSLHKQLKLAVAEDPSLSIGKILWKAAKNYFNFRASLSVKESKHKAIEDIIEQVPVIVFKAQVSDDPEDKLEFPISIDCLLALHASCHEALKKAGVPIPDDRTTQ